MNEQKELDIMKKKIFSFFEKNFPEKNVSEETIIFELLDNSSIEFVTTLCKLEEELDREIYIEKIENITKVSVADILLYI